MHIHTFKPLQNIRLLLESLFILVYLGTTLVAVNLESVIQAGIHCFMSVDRWSCLHLMWDTSGFHALCRHINEN